MPSQFKKPRQYGFTLVELMIVVVISLLLTGIIISFILAVTGQLAVSTIRGQMNTQITSATNRLESDIRYARLILAENSVPDGAAPSNDNRWNSGSDQLVLGATARNNANEPLSADYTTSLDNYIYYLNSGTLYRRVLAFSDSNNRYTTSTCAQTLNGGCASDTAILRNIESLEFTYYDNSGAETSDYAQASSIKVVIVTKTKQSRHEIELKGGSTFRLVSYASGSTSGPGPKLPAPTSIHCFLLDNGGTRVRNYYDYEYNNSANPACPRDVVIPAAITDFFSGSMGSKSLTSVVFIEEGQEIDIGSSAFSGNNLTSITITPSIVDIGSHAFSNNQISSLTIPDRSTPIDIGSSVFRGNNITSVAITPSMGNIGSYAFADNQITTITTLDRSTPISIGSGAFSVNKLTSVAITPSMGNIGSSAFADNQITTITVLDRPAPIVIGSSAFRNNSFTTVDIPPTVKSLGSNAFQDNSIILAQVSNSTTLSSSSFPSSTMIVRY